LRQAYDYWQDQPGNYGAREALRSSKENQALQTKQPHTMCRSTRRFLCNQSLEKVQNITVQTSERINAQGSYSQRFDTFVVFWMLNQSKSQIS